MKTTTRVQFMAIVLALMLAGAGKVLAKDEPFFDGLGSYKHKVTTESKKAQRYFDQGLPFTMALILPKRSAPSRLPLRPIRIAPWRIGESRSLGLHINLPVVPPAAAELATKESKLAQEKAAGVTAVERDLIEALSHRYTY